MSFGKACPREFCTKIELNPSSKWETVKFNFPFQVPEGRTLHSSSFKGGDLLPPGQVQDPCLQRRLDCRLLSCICYARRVERVLKSIEAVTAKRPLAALHIPKRTETKRWNTRVAALRVLQVCSLWRQIQELRCKAAARYSFHSASRGARLGRSLMIFGRLDSMQIQTKNGPWRETPPHGFLELDVRVER